MLLNNVALDGVYILKLNFLWKHLFYRSTARSRLASTRKWTSICRRFSASHPRSLWWRFQHLRGRLPDWPSRRYFLWRRFTAPQRKGKDNFFFIKQILHFRTTPNDRLTQGQILSSRNSFSVRKRSSNLSATVEPWALTYPSFPESCLYSRTIHSVRSPNFPN